MLNKMFQGNVSKFPIFLEEAPAVFLGCDISFFTNEKKKVHYETRYIELGM